VGEQTLKKESMWTAQFIAVTIAFIATQFAQSMVQSTFSRYIFDLGATATLVGTLTSIFALVGMCMRIVFGPLMKTYSRKLLAIISAIIQVGAYVGYAFTPTIMGAAGVRVVQGIGHCMSAGVFLALASECLPKSRMTDGIGMFTAIPMIFTAWANPLMLLIVEKTGWQTAYLTSAGLMLLAMIITCFLKYEDPNKGLAERPKLEIKLVNIVGKGTLVPILLMLVIKAAVGYGYVQVFAKALNENLAVSIGLTGTISLWVTVVSRPFVTKADDKFGFINTEIVMMLFTIACYWVYASSTTMLGFCIGAVLQGLSFEHCQVLLKALFIKYMPDNMRGVAANASMFALDAASFLAPIITGWIVDQFGGGAYGYGMGFRVWSAVPALAIIMLLASRKNVVAHVQAFEANKNNEAA
jgi:MFS family permease